jgi:NAD(P)-dependent dehydrogenase (short-subunit alcohol dehydrogenase family)
MKIGGSVALVTGANRGLGQAFARELVRRGAAKVYGAARHPDAITADGITPVALDVTNPEQVVAVHAAFIDTEVAALASGSRYWRTRGPGTSRPRWPAITSCSARPSSSSGTPP